MVSGYGSRDKEGCVVCAVGLSPATAAAIVPRDLLTFDSFEVMYHVINLPDRL